jgi:hypothetical protein
MNCSHCGKPAEARELKAYAGRCEECWANSTRYWLGTSGPSHPSALSGEGKRQKADKGWANIRYGTRVTREGDTP